MAKLSTLPKRQLEVRLGKLRILENPKLALEQYPVSPEVASELLFMAVFEHQDLQGGVIDLGTGTGRLAIGASLLGADRVIGVDIDKRAIALAVENARNAQVRVEWVATNLEGIKGSFDCVIMNPPYGTRIPHTDSLFLSRALELAPVIYTIHKSSTRTYLMEFVRKRGGKVHQVRRMTMRIPHMFDFHRKKWETVDVDLYRIVS